MDGHYLIGNFITEFDENYNSIRNIKSNKINISKTKWLIADAKVYEGNNYTTKKTLELNTNFDLKRINTLYSNLGSMNLYELYELRKNYKRLNYSITEVDLQLLKLISFPFFYC